MMNNAVMELENANKLAEATKKEETFTFKEPLPKLSETLMDDVSFHFNMIVICQELFSWLET